MVLKKTKRKSFNYINIKILGLVGGISVVGLVIMLMRHYGVLFNQEAGVLINWSDKKVMHYDDKDDDKAESRVNYGSDRKEFRKTRFTTSISEPTTTPVTTPRPSLANVPELGTYVVEGGEMYVAVEDDVVTEVSCMERVCYSECPEYEVIPPNGKRYTYIDHKACREVCEWRDCPAKG